MVDEGTAVALLGFVEGGGCCPGVDEGVESLGGFGGELAEGGVKGDGRASLALAVEEESVGNGEVEHFLEAEGLGAELDFVGLVALGFAAFVFDGDDLGVCCGRDAHAPLVEFDDVALAGEAEDGGGDGQGTGDADTGTGFVWAVVGSLVQDLALGREAVLGPSLFQMDQGGLPGAKEKVLEGGEGEELVFGEHGEGSWFGIEAQDAFDIVGGELDAANLQEGLGVARGAPFLDEVDGSRERAGEVAELELHLGAEDDAVAGFEGPLLSIEFLAPTVVAAFTVPGIEVELALVKGHGSFVGKWGILFDYSHVCSHIPVVTVSKGKLKAKMLEYFREVERTGEPLIVTDHGREVLEVRRIRRTATVEELLAEYRAGPGKGVTNCSEGELLAPVALEDWEALNDDETERW